jgi:hypothetical protein
MAAPFSAPAAAAPAGHADAVWQAYIRRLNAARADLHALGAKS